MFSTRNNIRPVVGPKKIKNMSSQVSRQAQEWNIVKKYHEHIVISKVSADTSLRHCGRALEVVTKVHQTRSLECSSAGTSPEQRKNPATEHETYFSTKVYSNCLIVTQRDNLANFSESQT